MRNLPEAEIAGRQIVAGLIQVDKITGEDETDTALLRKMAEDAKQYITSFSWCDSVLDMYFGGGFGGIFAVFFVHIRPARSDVDPWIWVMIGDVPPAYLAVSDCDSAAQAFRAYMRGMSKWVELARKGQAGTSQQGVPPVELPTTPEWAERVGQKLYGLTLTVAPLFQGSSPDTVH